MTATGLTLYGLKSCDTCRKARKWLDENSVSYEYHDVRDNGLDTELLERWTGRLAWEKFLNKKSLTWRKIPEVDRADMNQVKAIATILEYPTLVKRPVLECDEYIAIGFTADNYEKLFAG